MNSKGQYGYIKKYKKWTWAGVIILGILILVGVITSLVQFGTTKTLLIILPILICLPFAKQVVALIMCWNMKPLSDADHAKVVADVTYSDSEDLLFDISISRYEGMLFFPAVVVRDGRMVFLYTGTFGKKIADGDTLKKEIMKAFDKIKNPYLVIVATSVDDFVKKANAIKEPDEDYLKRDASMREKLFEMGI